MPYSQTAPGVEILEIADRLLRIEKNPRDQETRQNEKEVDAHPAVGEDAVQVDERVFGGFVMEDHEKDGDTANAVELGEPASARCSSRLTHSQTAPGDDQRRRTSARSS